MKTEYYQNKSDKLEKSLGKYLKKLEKSLIGRYGENKTLAIVSKAKNHYPNIIPKDQKTIFTHNSIMQAGYFFNDFVE